jgi:hypothetical protein
VPDLVLREIDAMVGLAANGTAAAADSVMRSD